MPSRSVHQNAIQDGRCFGRWWWLKNVEQWTPTSESKWCWKERTGLVADIILKNEWTFRKGNAQPLKFENTQDCFSETCWEFLGSLPSPIYHTIYQIHKIQTSTVSSGVVTSKHPRGHLRHCEGICSRLGWGCINTIAETVDNFSKRRSGNTGAKDVHFWGALCKSQLFRLKWH